MVIVVVVAAVVVVAWLATVFVICVVCNTMCSGGELFKVLVGEDLSERASARARAAWSLIESLERRDQSRQFRHPEIQQKLRTSRARGLPIAAILRVIQSVELPSEFQWISFGQPSAVLQ